MNNVCNTSLIHDNKVHIPIIAARAVGQKTTAQLMIKLLLCRIFPNPMFSKSPTLLPTSDPAYKYSRTKPGVTALGRETAWPMPLILIGN